MAQVNNGERLASLDLAEHIYRMNALGPNLAQEPLTLAMLEDDVSSGNADQQHHNKHPRGTSQPQSDCRKLGVEDIAGGDEAATPNDRPEQVIGEKSGPWHPASARERRRDSIDAGDKLGHE